MVVVESVTLDSMSNDSPFTLSTAVQPFTAFYKNQSNQNWLTCILPHAIKVTVVHVPLTRSCTPLMEYETEGELKMLLGPLSIRN